ncbi:hypothetical protein [Altericista sp. CCNU0014]|uniref:hypothetical protein n=1 Tax=Altericista sp. CCNU0014 TaxID=3082949 RepID=UPI00384D504F
MTLALQTPPKASEERSISPAAIQTPAEQPVPKSIFASKTFWGVVFTAVAAIAPIVGEKIDAHQFLAKDAAQIVVILCGAASAIIGRVDAGSVYTPKYLPGPNKPQ